MRPRLSSQPGFTLIEIVIYIAVVVVLLGSLGVLVGMTYKARAHTFVRREVEDQGRQVLEFMLHAARNGSSITAPAVGTSGAELTVIGDVFTTTFSLSGQAIMVTEDGLTSALTNSHILASDLTIQNLSRSSTPGTVRVQFTLSGTTSGPGPFSYSQTFYGSASLE